MDRASDYGSEGWGFESLQGHKKNQLLKKVVDFFVLSIFTITSKIKLSIIYQLENIPKTEIWMDLEYHIILNYLFQKYLFDKKPH